MTPVRRSARHSQSYKNQEARIVASVKAFRNKEANAYEAQKRENKARREQEKADKAAAAAKKAAAAAKRKATLAAKKTQVATRRCTRHTQEYKNQQKMIQNLLAKN